MFANLMGPDLAIVLAVLLVLFGGSQLPKLARSLGSASHEFRKGVEEGGNEGKGGPAPTESKTPADAKTTDSTTAESKATDQERSGS